MSWYWLIQILWDEIINLLDFLIYYLWNRPYLTPEKYSLEDIQKLFNDEGNFNIELSEKIKHEVSPKIDNLYLLFLEETHDLPETPQHLKILNQSFTIQRLFKIKIVSNMLKLNYFGSLDQKTINFIKIFLKEFLNFVN